MRPRYFFEMPIAAYEIKCFLNKGFPLFNATRGLISCEEAYHISREK